MKTAEKILLKCYDEHNHMIPFSSTSVIWKKAALKAMEEYAELKVTELLEKARNHSSENPPPFVML